MIRRVRRQFICITMAMLTAVLLVPLIALNVVCLLYTSPSPRD